MVKYKDACWNASTYGDSIDIHNILHYSILKVIDIGALYLYLNDEEYAMKKETSHHKDGYSPWWRLFGEKGQDFFASVSQGKGAFGHYGKVPPATSGGYIWDV